MKLNCAVRLLSPCISVKYGDFFLEVVVRVARADLGLREAGVEVAVEVTAERGDPLEAPPHERLVGLDALARRVGGHDEGSVAVREMHVDAVEVVGPERTAVAPLLPVGS